MTASNRRHTRYSVPEGALTSQEIRGVSVLARMLGWGNCRVRDLSVAGALIHSNKLFGIGDKIHLKLTQKSGVELLFDGEVMNCNKSYGDERFQLGIAIRTPAERSKEEAFLHNLATDYIEVH